MNIIHQVYDSLRWKKSDEIAAERLGLTLQKYKKIKNQILSVQEKFKDEVDDLIKEALVKRVDMEDVEDTIKGLKEKVTTEPISKNNYIEEDLEKGTAVMKGISSAEPRSPEEVEEVLKMDKTKWKLKRYWNKEHQGYWVVSAEVVRKENAEMTLEDIEECLSNVFVKAKFKPEKPPVFHGSNHKALFIYLSDRHIAAAVSADSLYSNEYNPHIYQLRLEQVFQEVLYLVQTQGRFEDIFIIDLGDKMDGLNGYTTRGGHKLPQNLSNREAFEAAIKVEKEFLDRLLQSDSANFYHVIQNCNSNHGGDFDYMVNRALEIYLNSVYPHVTTRMLTKFIEPVYYGKHILLFTHGKDTEDLKHGLPLHLNDKTENYLNKYLLYNKIDPSQSTVSLVKGDLHLESSEICYGFRYRNVLSLFGGSKWISSNFGPNRPGCSFDIIEAHTERIFEHRIFF